MKKLFLSMLLLALPLLACAYDAEVDGIYYNLNSEEKTAEVTYQSKDLYDNITSVYTGSVDIPEMFTYDGLEYTVTSIGNGAFYNCSGLISITIPNSVTSVADNAFSGCYGLPIENGVRYADTFLIGVVDKTQSSYPIKDGTRFIAAEAFYYCSNLTSVEIPNSVISIGKSVFSNCSSLTSVIIGNSVMSIGYGTFADCRYLKYVSIPNSVTTIGRSAFKRCMSLETIEIPNSVTSIGESAFEGCSGLTSVTMPSSVTRIEYYAFVGCTSLTSVHITDLESWCKIAFGKGGPSDLSSNPLTYAHHLFLNGEEIVDLVIPNTLTSIGGMAFAGCTNLKSVTIPSTVMKIGYDTFNGCIGLTTVTCYAAYVEAYTSFEASFGYSNYKNAILYVPEQYLSTYKSSEPWRDFKYIYAIEDGVPDKCTTPTISYTEKKLTFSCETEGVEYHYTITDSDIKSDVSSSIDLTATYEISVYATKSGYYDSDVATATLVWTDAIFTVTTPETPTSAKEVKESIPVLISANGGVITVKSEQEGQPVAVYTADGKALGSANVKDGQATVATNIQRGEIVIVKVGGRSVKVKMSDF